MFIIIRSENPWKRTKRLFLTWIRTCNCDGGGIVTRVNVSMCVVLRRQEIEPAKLINAYTTKNARLVLCPGRKTLTRIKKKKYASGSRRPVFLYIIICTFIELCVPSAVKHTSRTHHTHYNIIITHECALSYLFALTCSGFLRLYWNRLPSTVVLACQFSGSIEEKQRGTKSIHLINARWPPPRAVHQSLLFVYRTD